MYAHAKKEVALTITEIAKLAGVSIGPVDRVLHKRGRVSAKTVARIEEIIKSSGYHPNPIARQLASKKKFIIGVLLPKLSDDTGYWKLIYEGIKKAGEEFKLFSFEFIPSYFDRKEGSYTLKAKALLKKNINALITAPIIAQEAKKVLPLFEEIPYVLVDSSLPGVKQLATVVQNPYKGGLCAGRMMKLIAPHAKKIFCVQMYSGAYNLKERARGFTAFFKNKNVINISGNCNTKEETDKFIRSILLQKPDGIFVSNNAGFAFADYCKRKNIKKNFALVGYDLMEQNKKYLANGFIDCIISQQPEEQGYLAVKTIYQSCLINEKVNLNIQIPITLYYKENI